MIIVKMMMMKMMMADKTIFYLFIIHQLIIIVIRREPRLRPRPPQLKPLSTRTRRKPLPRQRQRWW